MAAQPQDDVITSYIDLGATGEQTSTFLDQINSVFTAYKKLAGTTLQLGGSDTLKTFTTNTKSASSAADELTKAKAKLAASETALAKEIALVNVQTAENSKNNKIAAQLQNSVAGSVEQAKIQIKDLGVQLNVLNVTTDAGKQKQAELITQL